MASDSQETARSVLERVLERPLTDFPPDPSGRPSPDYTDVHNEAFEMKRVTSEELRRLSNQIGRQGFFPSSRLSLRWSVMIEARTMGDKFQPMPPYPDDPDEAGIAALEVYGLRLTRKAEREADHRKKHAGQTYPTPRIRDLAPELEPHLLVLERAGITNTRGADRTAQDVRRALAEIARLTHNGLCIARAPSEHFEAGIAISLSHSHHATGDPNTLAFRVQAWLDSDLELVENLRASLWSSFDCRHGVLTLDSSEPEFWSAQDAGATFLPTLALDLPPEVDVLWCLVGSVLLRYEADQGWQSQRIM